MPSRKSQACALPIIGGLLLLATAHASETDFKVIMFPSAVFIAYAWCKPQRVKAPQYFAVRSLVEWNAACDATDPNALAATQKLGSEIDFHHYTLLIADAGGRANVENTLVFTSVRSYRDQVWVNVLEIIPLRCPSIATVNPDLSAYALIPKTDKPIHFTVSSATEDCANRKPVS